MAHVRGEGGDWSQQGASFAVSVVAQSNQSLLLRPKLYVVFLGTDFLHKKTVFFYLGIGVVVFIYSRVRR